MIIQGQVGIPSVRQSGGSPTIAQGGLAEVFISELTPNYYTLLKSGRVFFANASAQASTAFTGGAGGTPLIGIMNPASSGFDIVVLQTRVAVRTTGTGSTSSDFCWWAGPSVLPTGTQTTPINSYSLQASGSAAKAFVNTAMTGSTALSMIGPVASLGLPNGTAALNIFQSLDMTQGAIVAAPGNLLALGCSASLASSSMDITVFWAELPA